MHQEFPVEVGKLYTLSTSVRIFLDNPYVSHRGRDFPVGEVFMVTTVPGFKQGFYYVGVLFGDYMGWLALFSPLSTRHPDDGIGFCSPFYPPDTEDK